MLARGVSPAYTWETDRGSKIRAFRSCTPSHGGPLYWPHVSPYILSGRIEYLSTFLRIILLTFEAVAAGTFYRADPVRKFLSVFTATDWRFLHFFMFKRWMLCMY